MRVLARPNAMLQGIAGPVLLHGVIKITQLVIVELIEFPLRQRSRRASTMRGRLDLTSGRHDFQYSFTKPSPAAQRGVGLKPSALAENHVGIVHQRSSNMRSSHTGPLMPRCMTGVAPAVIPAREKVLGVKRFLRSKASAPAGRTKAEAGQGGPAGANRHRRLGGRGARLASVPKAGRTLAWVSRAGLTSANRRCLGRRRAFAALGM